MLEARDLYCERDERTLFRGLSFTVDAGEWVQVTGGNGAGKTTLLRLLTGLAGFEDVPVAQLSAGQQRRVALARLWLTRAALWVLDEPFTAIDVNGVARLTRRMAAHTAQGGMVILTTHQPLPGAADTVRRLVLTGGGAGL
ncbi:ATP-binding cassette domain-containing protein [Salmonella enterica]|nr:ATP-binding cassette domain-containing protein [Salmonella enterica]EJN1293918.1 ATP-binding cassette domain-containing protein [Salmonella enterica subsp. enterica serovar Hartford]EAP9589090.1 ATP-binding cassette domain-containing protein [Salmonella enterica]EDY6252988.1 ATP-binding cassette domain-containing protein [Salmonella enterica]EEQ1435748.1 ATP-binding cassette domain-containing protein [Salmonella enterica]